MKDKQFQLEFAADGRLTSSSATVSGAGAAVIEAGIRVGTFVASTILGSLGGMFLLAEGQAEQVEPPRSDTFDETLKQERSELYERRESYRAALTSLQDQLAAHGQAVANTPTIDLLAKVRVLQRTIERVRAEAERVEHEVDAWFSNRFPTASKQHVFTVGTDVLPQLPSATPTAVFDVDELDPSLRSAATTLGVVVARVAEVEEDALNFTSEDLEDESGIWFRTVRPTTLAVYERDLALTDDYEVTRVLVLDDDDGVVELQDDDLEALFARPFSLRKVMPAWVVDSDSRLGFLRFDSGIFDKQTGALGFGDTGALTKLSSTDESPARQLSAAFSAAPGQIKESVDQAVAVMDNFSKLRAAGAERELADIERRRKILEAEIAEKGVLATRSQREELETLKVREQIAQTQKNLQTPSASPNLELEQQIARVKLELELKQIQVEMEWLKQDD